jgi:hypothetical protein
MVRDRRAWGWAHGFHGGMRISGDDLADMPDAEIPSFLLRKGTPSVTTQTPVKTPKKRRIDCFASRLAISIPLDPANPGTYAEAISALRKLKDALPENTLIETLHEGLSKMPAV